MSLKHNSIFARIFCAALVLFGFNFCIPEVHAQVPTTIPLSFANKNPNTSEKIEKQENTIVVGHTVVKVIAPETAIPFGAPGGSTNSALLDMKGNDQEFARSFTFKNVSNLTYTINSVDFEKQDNIFEFLSIDPGESFPIEVAPGQTFSIRIAFHAIKRNELCINSLTFLTEERKDPIAYPIQAIQLPFSSMPWNNKMGIAQSK
jgi:hypothetical protein